jgi:hypothetical protein
VVRSDEDNSGAPRAVFVKEPRRRPDSAGGAARSQVSKTKRLTIGVAQAAPAEIAQTAEVKGSLSSMFIRARWTGTILDGKWTCSRVGPVFLPIIARVTSSRNARWRGGAQLIVKAVPEAAGRNPSA